MRPANNKTHKTRVAVLTNVIPGYRLPVFKGLSDQDEIALKFFVSLPLEESDVHVRDTLEIEHSRGINLRRRTAHHTTGTDNVEWLHIPVMLFFDLLFFRPDIVISGEFGLRSCIAWLVSRIRRIPLIIWSEEIAEHAAGISGFQMRLRKFLIPRADGFLAWGNPAVDYLHSWGVDEKRIYYCAQAVDNEFWRTQSQQYDKVRLRHEFGLSGRVFVAVGRLMARKGFDRLIKAWGSMDAPAQSGCTLVIVGGGPEEASLKTLVETLGIKNIVFAGIQPPEVLARYYAAADVFVFPSLVDVWGLVVNEAMACGLPVLASKYAGASQELVGNPGVGELFDPNDQIEFTAVLQCWCENVAPVDHDHIRAVVSRLNFDVTISAIKKAIIESNHCDSARRASSL